MIKEYQLNQAGKPFFWFDVCELDSADATVLGSEHALGANILGYVTDQFERPHYDYDIPTQTEMIVYDVPRQPDSNQDHFSTCPIAFLTRGDALFTFHPAEVQYVVDDWRKNEKLLNSENIISFIFQALLLTTKHFQTALTTLNSQQKRLDVALSSDIDNDQLKRLSEVDKSLIYIENAAKQNLLLLESILKLAVSRNFPKAERELLDDVLIEARQATRTAQIISEVTSRIMATSNTVLNNNLNDTMKFLTIWSLAMTIPTIITGFYGMNIKLPFTDSSWAWLAITGFTGGLIWLLYIIFKRRHLL